MNKRQIENRAPYIAALLVTCHVHLVWSQAYAVKLVVKTVFDCQQVCLGNTELPKQHGRFSSFV